MRPSPSNLPTERPAAYWIIFIVLGLVPIALLGAGAVWLYLGSQPLASSTPTLPPPTPILAASTPTSAIPTLPPEWTSPPLPTRSGAGTPTGTLAAADSPQPLLATPTATQTAPPAGASPTPTPTSTPTLAPPVLPPTSSSPYPEPGTPGYPAP